LITLEDVDWVFSDKIVEELAGIIKVAERERLCFAQSVRVDARLFIEAKRRPNAPQLYAAIKRLYDLNTSAECGDSRVAQELARAVGEAPQEVWDWLGQFTPAIAIPTPAEIVSPTTRHDAIEQLRLVLTYGDSIVDGRKRRESKRPSGRSITFKPLLQAANSAPNRPRSEAESEFVAHLGLTYLIATDKQPPKQVHYNKRGPFSRFVHRCFELVEVPNGSVTELINDFGRLRCGKKPRERGMKKKSLSGSSA
jgi:hypothetical protein